MVAELLGRGEDGSVSVADLCASLGVSDRELRRIIEMERTAGALICARKTGGYYLANRREDLEAFVRAAAKRAETARRTAKPFRTMLKKREGAEQMKISVPEG